MESNKDAPPHIGLAEEPDDAVEEPKKRNLEYVCGGTVDATKVQITGKSHLCESEYSSFQTLG